MKLEQGISFHQRARSQEENALGLGILFFIQSAFFLKIFNH